jgi:hypothetical protein
MIPNWGFIPTATIPQKIHRGQGYLLKTEFQGREKGNYKIGKTGANFVGGNSSEIWVNGATLRQAQGPPPPTQVKFTTFHDRSRIVNVFKRIETFINVSFTTNSTKKP